jgi:hypothetical protein
MSDKKGVNMSSDERRLMVMRQAKGDLSGDAKAWVICILAICITAICIGVFTTAVKIKVNRLALEKGYNQEYVISSQSYSKVWVKRNKENQ